MTHLSKVAVILSAALSACAGPHVRDLPSAKKSIEASLQRTAQATQAKDIEAYMAEIPQDFVINDESGEVITRDQQRKNILRDWSIIPRTISLTNVVESIDLNGNVAIVTTTQRWERLMLQRDQKSTDHVVTTQKHRETWRHTPKGWFAYEIDELGGDIFVNGKPYKP